MPKTRRAQSRRRPVRGDALSPTKNLATGVYHSQKCVNKRRLSTRSNIVIRRHALKLLRTRDLSLKLSDPKCKENTGHGSCTCLLSLSHSSPYSFLFGASLPALSLLLHLLKFPRVMLSQTPSLPIVFSEHLIQKNMNPNVSVETIDHEILEAACILVNISQGILTPKTYTGLSSHLPISTPSSSHTYHSSSDTIRYLEESPITFSATEQISRTPTDVDGSTVPRRRPQQSLWSFPGRS